MRKTPVYLEMQGKAPVEKENKEVREGGDGCAVPAPLQAGGSAVRPGWTQGWWKVAKHRSLWARPCAGCLRKWCCLEPSRGSTWAFSPFYPRLFPSIIQDRVRRQVWRHSTTINFCLGCLFVACMCFWETKFWESSAVPSVIGFILEHITILISNLFKYLGFLILYQRLITLKISADWIKSLRGLSLDFIEHRAR